MIKLFLIPFLFLSFFVGAKNIDESIDKGVAFLIKGQKPDGSWGGPTKTKFLNIYAPGVRAHLAFKNATTALCLTALSKTAIENSDVKKAMTRGYDYLIETVDQVKRVDGPWLGNVWTHAFTIQAFLELEQRSPQVNSIIDSQINLLNNYQALDGGWGYYDFKAKTVKPSGSSVSFMTATVLIILKEAEKKGFKVDSKMTSRALTFLASQRKPDNSFLYSNDFKYHTNLHVNKIIASLARTQPSLRALYDWQFDDVKKEEISHWVKLIIKRNMWLDMARKRPRPHESWNNIASYFYYYGMYHAAENLPLCSEKQNEYSKELADIVMERQEKNGAWFDFPLYDYGHYYGTAYGLLALAACRN